MEKKLPKQKKALSLNKETLRFLNEPELREALGGNSRNFCGTEWTCSQGLCCPEN